MYQHGTRMACMRHAKVGRWEIILKYLFIKIALRSVSTCISPWLPLISPCHIHACTMYDSNYLTSPCAMHACMCAASLLATVPVSLVSSAFVAPLAWVSKSILGLAIVLLDILAHLVRLGFRYHFLVTWYMHIDITCQTLNSFLWIHRTNRSTVQPSPPLKPLSMVASAP